MESTDDRAGRDGRVKGMRARNGVPRHRDGRGTIEAQGQLGPESRFLAHGAINLSLIKGGIERTLMRDEPCCPLQPSRTAARASIGALEISASAPGRAFDNAKDVLRFKKHH